MNQESFSEELWYNKILSGSDISWDFLPKKSLFSSYDAILRSEIIVSIGSTLGYEAFCRGKKTAFRRYI